MIAKRRKIVNMFIKKSPTTGSVTGNGGTHKRLSRRVVRLRKESGVRRVPLRVSKKHGVGLFMGYLCRQGRNRALLDTPPKFYFSVSRPLSRGRAFLSMVRVSVHGRFFCKSCPWFGFSSMDTSFVNLVHGLDFRPWTLLL